ncbi:MAG: EAL domain-containing protein [Hyphomicrobium sp.]
MGSTETKAKRPQRRSRSTAADAFVVLAMTLTTVALAIGLYLQFRLAFWLAVVAALSVYVGLLALHALVRRSEKVERLTAEIERLESELNHVSAGAKPGVAMPGDGPMPATAAAPAPVSPAVSMSGTGTLPQRPSPAGAPPHLTPMPPVAPSVSTAQGAPVSQRTGQPHSETYGPRSEAGMAAAAQTESARNAGRAPNAMPPVGGPAVAPAALPSAPRQTGASPASGTGPAERGVSERAVDAILNDYWAFRPSQPPRLPGAVPPGSLANATGPAGMSEDVGPPTSAQVLTGPQPSVQQPPALPPPLPRSAPPPVRASAPAATGALTAAEPPPMPPSPRQTDVDMIGGLIKKMADEINAVEADRLRNPAGSDRVPPAAIEASVNALRTTADQMRGSATTTEMRGSATTAEMRGTGDPATASLRQRPAMPAAPQPPGWDDDTRLASEIRSPKRPASAHVDPTRAAAVAERPAPVAVQPPPLPVAQDASPIVAQNVPRTASPRHAMERPAARELPPLAEPVGYAPMPWPEQDDDAARAGTAPGVPAATVAHSRLAALAEAITAGRLDVLLDPILGLADQRARHFEVSVRLKDKNGQVLEPPDGVPELRESGLLPLLDCARIQRSAQVANRLADRGKSGSLFSAFSGEALSHDQFLADFADLYSAREGLATQLVLSFGQADVRGFAGRDWDTIAEMRELGFRFALQSITDLDMDLEALKSAGFDFVKLDASVFLDGMPASGGVVPAGDICRHLALLGLTLIVGRIDDEAQLARIFGFGVIYGQGQLFGGARPMKTEALGEASHAAA